MNTILQKFVQVCRKAINKKQKTDSTYLIKVVRNRSGSSLLGVVIFSIVMSITATGLIVVASSGSINEAASYDNDRAFFAAESGLLMGASWLTNESAWASFNPLVEGAVLEDVIPNLTVNDFNVQVDMMKVDSGVRIRSTAISYSKLGYNKLLCQDAEPDGIAPFDTTAFDYAIICDGTFDFKGCGSISAQGRSNAYLHSNSDLDIGGNASANLDITSSTKVSLGNKTVNGTITAPVLDLHQNAIVTGGATEDAVDEVPIPDIDLTPWYEEAYANGEVHNGFTISSSYTPDGGILWVNGDVHLSGGPGTTFHGQIIATGNVSISGQVNINAPEGGFAIACRDGDVTITTSGTIKGLVYCKTGDYKQTANGRLEGQLIVKGSIEKGGNSDVVVFGRCIPTVPGGDGISGKLVAGTWQEANVAP